MSVPLLPLPGVEWPTVPACYGWLSLNRRGVWKLQGQAISHRGLIAYINAHYGADEAGNWVLANGPQAVYVALDYTPLVWRLDSDHRVTAHTGAVADQLVAVYLDDEGNALLQTTLGIGLLDDRDLPAFLLTCRNGEGEPAREQDLLDVMMGGSGVFWRGLPLNAINRQEVPGRFGFCPTPAARA